MRRGFTLVEMIVTIVILSILSAGTFVSLKHLYLRSAKSKAIGDLSLESQLIVDQISSLMYDRLPSSVIGYNSATNTFESIYLINNDFTILEWIGIANEAHTLRAYSGLVDMNTSNSITLKLSSVGMNSTLLNTTMNKKFTGKSSTDMGLVFAGSFDDGAIYYSGEFATSFGWHGNAASKIFNFTIPLPNDGNITLSTKPNEIYEKYYFLDSAYAVARGEDVNVSTCNTLGVTTTDNTLFLFYDYRPWKNETFCGDKNGVNKVGKVTILSQNVSGLQSGVINGTIYFNLTMNKVIRGSDNNVTLSKQKAVY